MKNRLAAFAIATTILAPLTLTEARAGSLAVSPVIAGLISSANGCGPEVGCAPAAALAPAIFGYGYRLTYYGRGYSFQPAYGPRYTPYARPRFMGRCCGW